MFGLALCIAALLSVFRVFIYVFRVCVYLVRYFFMLFVSSLFRYVFLSQCIDFVCLFAWSFFLSVFRSLGFPCLL